MKAMIIFTWLLTGIVYGDIEQTCRNGIPGYDPWRDAGECVFDHQAAVDACCFFSEHLTHIKGKWARTPFHLRRWQRAVVGNLFGWKKPDGTRRYTEVLLYLPRKNGKSLLGAGILNYLFFCDGTIGAEICCAANTRDQARVVWNMAYQMIRQSDQLSDLCTLYKNSIADEDSASRFIPVSSEANTLDGPGWDAACVDEIHQAPNSGVIDVIETSQGSIEEPMLLLTTTAAEEGESVCNDKHDYACKVRDGEISDSSYLPVIYELLKDEDWTDPKNWARVNPNLGISPNIGYFQKKFNKAKESPAFENVFKRLHLNMKTEQESRWLVLDRWDACGEGVKDPVAWRYEILEYLKENAGGTARCAGLDIGSVDDLTAFVLVFEHDDRTFLIPFFWIPEGGLNLKDHNHKSLYQAWINQGFITTTEGDAPDYPRIAEEIDAICTDYNIVDIGLDAIFQGASVYTMLTNVGYTLVTIRQTWTGMTAPTKEFEERMVSKNIAHGNNPVLRWMASNVALKTDGTDKNMRPEKPRNKNGTVKRKLKIDGIVAAIMGLARQIVHDDNESIFDTEGVTI